jgi:hypothetical protein
MMVDSRLCAEKGPSLYCLATVRFDPLQTFAPEFCII